MPDASVRRNLRRRTTCGRVLTLVSLCTATAVVAQTQVPPPLQSGAATAANSGSSTLAWMVGLACGVALMVGLKIDWRLLPTQGMTWLRLQRHAAAWAALGALSLAVILFY
jgi:hypothetical protein